MTLICSVQGNGFGFFATSDILLSTDYAKEVANPPTLSLPLQIEPVQHSNDGRSLVGIAQKMIAAGRTLLQWSGNEAVARAICSRILQDSNGGRSFIEPMRSISAIGLLDTEVKNVCLIYHYQDDFRVYRYNHRANEYQIPNAKILIQGSGSWHFLEDTLLKNTDGSDFPSILNSFKMRTIFQLLTELSTDKSNYDFFYGGWMEMAKIEGNCFVKIPYAIKLWEVDDGRVYNMPLFFNTYHGDVLHLHQLSLSANLKKYDLKRIRVPPFLKPFNTDQPDYDAEIVWDPEFVCHCIYGPQINGFKVSIVNLNRDDMDIRFHDGHISFHYSEAMLEKISKYRTLNADGFPPVRFSRSSKAHEK